MYINVFYDEENIADVIFVPDCINDIEKLQYSFFEWLFDKDNDHKYWVYEDGEKKYCSYGVSAFVEWMNETILHSKKEKAKVIKEYTQDFCVTNFSLNF